MSDQMQVIASIAEGKPVYGGHGSRRAGRVVLEVRQNVVRWQQALILIASVVVGLTISCVILVFSGVPASKLLEEFVYLTLLDPQSFKAVLVQMAPLTLAALSAAIAIKSRFWNIGIEGQMMWGGIAATFIAVNEIGASEWRMALMLIAAIVAGGCWALVALWFKRVFNVNEVLSTLMMNYLVMYLLFHLLTYHWADPVDRVAHSRPYLDFERLPALESFDAALLLVIVVTILTWWLLSISRIGFMLRCLQANERMAGLVGLPVLALTAIAVAISGGVAALAGVVVSTEIQGRLTTEFFVGYGFSGILIAFLARNHPLGAALVAFLFSTLAIAGQSLQVFYHIPFAMVQLIQALVVMCVAGSEFFIRYRILVVR
jgi:ABC-type uncharacterized transport system permease subunit